MFGLIFYEGRKGKGEGRENKANFASPKLGDLEGRGGETSFLFTILIILTYLSSYIF
jgi:hypothetical protein